MIKKSKDELAHLKTILKDTERLKIISEQQIKKIDEIKKELEELEIKKSDTLEQFDEDLRISMLRSRFLERRNNIKEEIKLRNVIRKKVVK